MEYAGNRHLSAHMIVFIFMPLAILGTLVSEGLSIDDGGALREVKQSNDCNTYHINVSTSDGAPFTS